MGDQCVNIAKLIPLDGPRAARPTSEMLRRSCTMGKQVKSLLTQAKKAFADRDVELARDLVRQDDVVDNLNKECFQLAVEIGDDNDMREWAMTMMLVARALERIGDNAVDIGEQVAFVVTGLFREFEDASTSPRRLVQSRLTAPAAALTPSAPSLRRPRCSSCCGTAATISPTPPGSRRAPADLARGSRPARARSPASSTRATA